MSHDDAAGIVNRFLQPDTIAGVLGAGKDGVVFSTTRRTAAKQHYRPHTYRNELAVYRRLAEHRVARVNGFAVPRLYGCHEEHLILELSWVSPPFVLDFAGSQLDIPFDFEQEVWEMWYEQRQEEYGERWPKVLALIDAFERRFGIYLDDISPRNVRFEND